MRTNFRKLLLIHTILLVFVVIPIVGQAQIIPVGLSLFNDDIRTRQLAGDSLITSSLLIRPNFTTGNLAKEYYGWNSNDSVTKRKIYLKVLPFTFHQQFNSHHPYGWNDGSLIPAKGYQNQLSGGFYLETGPLSIQIQPEMVFAQNANFELFPGSYSDSIWKAYYRSLNLSDIPEQMGTGSYFKFFPGQSSIRLNHKALSLGISSENLWWGPGSRNSLLLSNTAPGFLHVTFNTRRPVKTPIGTIEWQLISGRLKESGIIPPDTSRRFEGQPLYEPKPKGDRYLNAINIAWQPKWINGLYVGFSRSFMQYSHTMKGNLNDYLPVFGFFFKGNTRSEDNFGRDQLLAFYLRWVLQKEAAEFYAEIGRNDHSGSMRDFVVQPEHSLAYIFGFKKLFIRPARYNIEFSGEVSNLGGGRTGAVRDMPTWYQHHQVKHGYTNFGQVIGAGIGPGSNSQTVGLNWLKSNSRRGISIERILRNNDFYYQAFAGSRISDRHWVDLSINPYISWRKNSFLYTANASLVRSLNYQWRKDTNAFNFLGSFSVSYLF
jgi:hypothetical protein